jgi:hypothetical protein
MATTSNRTPIDLTSNGEDIDFEGWECIDKNIYELWLSPCKTWLVQWYNWYGEPHWRNRRTAYEHDCVILEQYFNGRGLRWCPRVRGFKNWDFQIIHDFEGCEWLGRQATPDPIIGTILRDLETNGLSWPTLENRNLYRTQDGLTACLGANLCFEDQAQPINLAFWSDLMRPEQAAIATQLPRESDLGPDYVDLRIWRDWRFQELDKGQ